MQPRARTLSAVTLGAAMLFGAAAMAADLPKEGTFSHTTSAFFTFKGTPIGKGRFLNTWDNNGLSVGTGLTDHMTWHCFGLQDTTDGMAEYNGYCVTTDPDGDQIVFNVVSDGKFAWDAKSVKGRATLTTGTGKYAGITGTVTYVCHSAEFKTAAEGTGVLYCPSQGSYKLP